MKSITVLDIEQLDSLCEKLSKLLQIGDTILLDGDLGSGKTEFVAHVAKHLGIKEDITSPTFCFMNEYCTKAGFMLYHFDLYRLNSEDELSSIGFDEFGFNPANGVSFIEWANKFSDLMPKDSLHVNIEGRASEPRTISCEATTTVLEELIEKWI